MTSGTVVALVLSLRSAAAGFVCACPSQATCGVADLFRVSVTAAFESTILDPPNCVPDVNGHLEADVYIQNDLSTSVQFPTITSLGGALRVTSGAGLTVLDLPALRHVGGYMWWQQNPALATVNVPALESVDGYLKITLAGGLEVLHMSALQSVGGYFWCHQNAALAAVDMPALESVDGYLKIQLNEVLVTANLPALLSTGDYLVIKENVALVNVDLSALDSVGSDFYIKENAALTNVDLSVLDSVGNFVEIEQNSMLAVVDMPHLVTVGAILRITHNGAMTAVDVPLLQTVGTMYAGTSNDAFLVSNNGRLSTLRTPMLRSVGTLNVVFNPELVELDMRRLTSGDSGITGQNNAAIVTTLACATKAMPWLRPAGATTIYWNEFPAVCHDGTTTTGNDDMCSECSDYVSTCGIAGACLLCNVTGPPMAAPGFVKFEVSEQPSAQLASQVYPCVGTSCDDACRCPFDTTCDIATDLVNTQGLAGQQECTPTSTGSLDANVYVYGNPTIETITLSGIVSVGSLVFVNCPNLRTVSALDTTIAGNVTVQSCDSLESMSAPMLSSTGFFEIDTCFALTSLEVANISTIGGALTIDRCESLPDISFPVLEVVGGPVAISNAAQVQSIGLNMLRSASAVVISGVGGNSRAVLPCSAKQQPWESQIAGTVRYSSGATVVCHDRMSTFGGEFDDICSECDVCADCSMDGAPQIMERFASFRVPSNEGVQLNAYPCHASECSSHTLCRCPFDTTTCDFSTDLVNAQGLAGQQECMPTAADSLDANVYVYGNPTIETIKLSGIVSVGSLLVVNCPNVQTISAPDTTIAGNVTVQSCDSLESMSAPMLSSTGFFEVALCSALTSLEVANISTIGGALTIDGCESLPDISFPVLEVIGGSVAISNAAQVQSIELNVLHAVSGSFSIAGVHSDAVTTLPCAARSKPWESASVGTVRYSTGVHLACQSASSGHTSNPTTLCDICDICVSCDNDDKGTPMLLPGFVQFIGEAATMEATHVFECEAKFGCHTATSTLSSNCINDRYEGHFCMSCASGYEHSKTNGPYEYECVECDTADLAISVLALAISAVVIGAIGTWAWKKQKRMDEAEVLAYQAVGRCIWQPIRTLIVYSQVNSQIGSVLNVSFPELFTDIMQHLGSVLSVAEILVGSECAGLDNFSTKWLKDIVLQPCVMLVVVALYYGYERKVSDKQNAQKHAAGNVFFVVFYCCK
jgi:hypothetical protein